MSLTGKAKLAGVMGWPVTHSRSPLIHNHWCKAVGVDGAYLPLAVDPENLETALKGLVSLGFRGCNLTIPHKEIVLPYLDEIDPLAKRIGAANTVVVRGDGSLFGFNTDGLGFLASVLEQSDLTEFSDRRCLILGAGGAARSIAVALSEAGAQIMISNRTRARAERLLTETGVSGVVVEWDSRDEALSHVNLVVNTSSLGMDGQGPLEIDLTPLPSDSVVADIVYAPLETDLLRQARSLGHQAVDGLGMLLHQAVPGFEAWFGARPTVTPALRRLVEQDLGLI